MVYWCNGGAIWGQGTGAGAIWGQGMGAGAIWGTTFPDTGAALPPRASVILLLRGGFIILGRFCRGGRSLRI